MRLLLRPILGQCDASRRPNDRVSHECHSAHCVVHQWCRLSDPVCSSQLKATPFTGEACETDRSLVKMESCWKTRGTVLLYCSQPSCEFDAAKREQPAIGSEIEAPLLRGAKIEIMKVERAGIFSHVRNVKDRKGVERPHLTTKKSKSTRQLTTCI